MPNPLYPVDDIGSVDELMALAAGMEYEAAQRYGELAIAMEEQGEPELAILFGHLAQLEREHETEIYRWAEREGMAKPLPLGFAWDMPETFPSDLAVCLPPHRALACAVQNEERAYAFYACLTALARDEPTRSHAEALAKEELKHVSKLRSMHRRAFQGERPEYRRHRRARTHVELMAMAHGLELASAEVDDVCAAVLDEAGETDAAALMRRQAGAARLRGEHLPELVGRSRGSPVAEGARAAGLLRPDLLTARGALELSLNNAGEVAEIYMDTAEQAVIDDLMKDAHALAEEAIARLAIVRSLVDHMGPDGRPSLT